MHMQGGEGSDNGQMVFEDGDYNSGTNLVRQ